MAETRPIVSHIYVKIDGNDLSDTARAHLLEVSVDQHVHLPSMFTIRLYDPGMKLLDGGKINLAGKVEIGSKTTDEKVVKLIEGEITALEPEFGEGMIAELSVRGYDKSHRLYRERNSKTWLNVKDSDLANEIAQKAGLTAKVDATPTVYEHLYQDNQSDLSFLRQRAGRIGYECFTSGKELFFRKPVKEAAKTTIAWGTELISFHPRMALAEQVEEVLVKGWDVQKKEAITGRADSGNLYPKIAEKDDGKAWAQKLGKSRMVIVDQPVVSQAEADIIATAHLDELSGTFIEAEGQAFRRPDIQAGQMLKIEGLGKRLSGEYLVTRANHLYTDAGLTTYFSVTGSRTGLLAEQFDQSPEAQRWLGVVPAIVTNTDDPNGWGRVKVKYPWMSDAEESGWARLLGVGAGPDCGLAAIPAVDDEVMVSFQHGEFNNPVVLGGMWNGQDALPTQVVGAAEGEKPLVRSWTSRTGHRITVHDDADNKIELETTGKHRMTLDDANQKIEIFSTAGHKAILDDSGKSITIVSSSGDLEIKMDENGSKVSVSSSGEVEVTAGRDLKMSGVNVKVEASGNMDLQAGGNTTVKGAAVNVDGSGAVNVTGGVIKLN